MPNPFPGMDPYLESPLYWQDVHERFISYAAEALQPQLPPRYRARIGERVVLAAVDRMIIPDVTVVQRPVPRDVGSLTGSSAVSGVMEVDTPTIFSTFLDDVCEALVEIIDRTGQRVITVLALLSPANKTPGAGREPYVQKQQEVLRRGTNLVEIDLLHSGPPTVAVPHANLVRARAVLWARRCVASSATGTIRGLFCVPTGPAPPYPYPPVARRLRCCSRPASSLHALLRCGPL